MKIAEVWANLPVKSIAQSYSYLVPEKFCFIGVGWRVFVPFGARKIEGFTVDVREISSEESAAGRIFFSSEEKEAFPIADLKPITSITDDEPWFTPSMLHIARWMAEFYLCSLAEAMRLFMPGNSGIKIAPVYFANTSEEPHPLLMMKEYEAIYAYLLEKEGADLKDLQKKFSETELLSLLERMQKYDLVCKDYLAKRRGNLRYENLYSLQGTLTEEMRARFRRSKAQLRGLEILAERGEQTEKELRAEGLSREVIKKLSETDLVRTRKKFLAQNFYGKTVEEGARAPLSKAQETAISALLPALHSREYQGFLLHGVTGSGKTRVYLEAALLARKEGRSILILVPEIALTSQLVRDFRSDFAEDFVVFHSRLTVRERSEAIAQIRRGEAHAVIGARSALFTPLENIGLIVLDEEQDNSYKQDEAPRYHGRIVAEEMARAHGAVFILGSATPSMESFHRAQMGELRLLEMKERIGNQPLPKITAVDMREELRQGHRRVISRELQRLLQETLAKGQQVILMLNRRGYSTFILCRACGEALKCKECTLPLVYHSDGKLLCHHCDIKEEVPQICPKCGSKYIKYFGSGTEKLEEELKKLLPQARTIRMDRDTTQRKFAHQEILEAFREGQYDILLGTQMVAKGHDVPSVTGVGILSADSALNLPDFRAGERCFMLITQTAGRAGRGKEMGRVVVQTYNPEHYAVICGIAQDYRRFYETEIKLRKELSYPPFRRILKIVFRGEDEEKTKVEARNFVEEFQKAFGNATEHCAIGPAPAMISKLRSAYRFVVLVKTTDFNIVRVFIKKAGVGRRMDVLLDFDPITMM